VLFCITVCSVPDFCQLLILGDELTLNVLCCHLVNIQLAVKLIQRPLMPECKARLCAGATTATGSIDNPTTVSCPLRAQGSMCSMSTS